MIIIPQKFYSSKISRYTVCRLYMGRGYHDLWFMPFQATANNFVLSYRLELFDLSPKQKLEFLFCGNYQLFINTSMS